MNLVPYKQLFVSAPFQETKYKNETFVCGQQNTRDYWRCVCPTCRNEKCVFLSTNKTTSCYDFKKCKACCHVLNIPFKDQKPTIMLFGGTLHVFLQERRDATTERTNHLHFEKLFPPLTTNNIRT